MRVLVTGAAGQLAFAIRQLWQEHELILPDEAQFNLGDPESVRNVVSGVKPQVLVNCGAFTQVDRCETEQETATRINGDAVGWLAEACDRHGAMLIQISTDYVFDGTGTRPYREEDPTNPQSVYGRTKLEGERQAATCRRHLIARTSWLYDAICGWWTTRGAVPPPAGSWPANSGPPPSRAGKAWSTPPARGKPAGTVSPRRSSRGRGSRPTSVLAPPQTIPPPPAVRPTPCWMAGAGKAWGPTSCRPGRRPSPK